MDKKEISFIGVGTMGRPMAMNLVNGGHSLLLHDLDVGKRLVGIALVVKVINQ